MNKTAHSIYLATLTLIVIAVTIYLFYYGASYYNTSMEERFYHTDHGDLKPSGVYGHGLGIIGTLLILIGVFGYMARKRYRILSRIGVLKTLVGVSYLFVYTGSYYDSFPYLL